MKLLRFGEPDINSTMRSFQHRIESADLLSADLRRIRKERRLPAISTLDAPIIEQWVIESFAAPMLTGYIYDPKNPDPKASEWLCFTQPLELLSVEQNLARSMTRWYRLGTPSPLAAEALKSWSNPHDR